MQMLTSLLSMSPNTIMIVYIIALLLLLQIDNLALIVNAHYNAKTSPKVKRVLIVAGNFTLGGEVLNFAQYDYVSDSWSNKYQADLFDVDSNGVVLNLISNHSETSNIGGVNKLYALGTFDTITKTSQVQFCSVGSWNGFSFEKVGEGLCPRGGQSVDNVPHRMNKIQAAVLGGSNGNEDLFVGGSFESRVWDGHHFVSILNLAQYHGPTASWMPLHGGTLKCTFCSEVMLYSLAWSEETDTLFIGGIFDSIDDELISPSIAMWTKQVGLSNFFTEGAWVDKEKYIPGFVSNLVMEPKSSSLFVAGHFNFIGGKACPSIAAWRIKSNEWTCLYSPSKGISTVTGMSLIDSTLFLAGWTSTTSDWQGAEWNAPYAIATLDISKYINSLEAGNYADNNYNSNNNNTYGRRNNSSNSDKYSSISDSKINRRRALLKANNARRDARGNNTRSKLEESTRKLKATKPALTNHLIQRNLSNNSNLLSAPPNSKRNEEKDKLKFDWMWMEGFKGGNGPILNIVEGKYEFLGCVFVIGAPNNYPAFSIWCDDSFSQNDNNNTDNILSMKYSVQGLVTSVVQIEVSVDEPAPPPPPTSDVNKASLVVVGLSGALIIGAIVGLYVLSNKRKSYSKILSDIDYSEEGLSLLDYRNRSITDSSNYGSGDSTKSPFALSSLLSDGGSSNSLEFSQAFERAMNARHLSTTETLLLINPKEVILHRIIGEGSYGRVWSGYWRNNAVAIKEFVFAQAAMVAGREGGLIQRNSMIEEIVGEAGVMTCLRHPKILQLYGCSLTVQSIWIASELCTKGSLRMLLNDRKESLSLLEKLSICLDVADGMMYLHSRNPPIIHRDLKSHNIFVTEASPGNLIAKIGDWGSARAIALSGSKSMTQGVGTACWLAPEVIYNAHFSKESDVYAYGVLLWEVYTRKEVYEGLSAAQIIAKVVHEGLRPVIPPQVLGQMCPWSDLMQECWHHSASLRPSFSKIVQTLSKIYSDMKNNHQLYQQYESAMKSSDSTSPKKSPLGRLLDAKAALEGRTVVSTVAVKSSYASDSSSGGGSGDLGGYDTT